MAIFSLWKSLVSNLGLEHSHFIDVHRFEIYHPDYWDRYHCFLKDYLISNSSMSNQILNLLVCVLEPIIFLAQSIILIIIQNDLADQNPHADMDARFDLASPYNLLLACYSNWFLIFTRRIIIFNSSRFCITSLV